jgi:hypothetical protein
LQEQIVRLQVKLTNDRLFAIRGDFELKVAYDGDELWASASRDAPAVNSGLWDRDGRNELLLLVIRILLVSRLRKVVVGGDEGRKVDRATEGVAK